MSSSFKREKRKSRYLFPFLIVLFLIVLFLTNPSRYAKSILKGIDLWALSVLPATFPFLFLTALLTAFPLFTKLMGKISPLFEKLFHASAAGGGIACLALLSGYPVGARLLGDAYREGRVHKSEVLPLSFLVTTSGPPFLVGTVGAIMFESAPKGWILLLSHILGVFSVCFVLSRFQKKDSAPPSPLQNTQNVSPTLVYDTLLNAVLSILCVGGLIALFYCLGDMLGDLKVFSLSKSVYFEGILRGLLEMTSGCSALSKAEGMLSLPLAAFLTTFGGACVLMQELAFLSHTKIPAGKFLLVKFLQGLCAFLSCLLLSRLFL